MTKFLVYFILGGLVNLLWGAEPAPLVRITQAINTRITSLNPFRLSGIDAYLITANVLEPLASAHPVTKTLQPCLAERWTVDLKTNTIRVHLRDGVLFHNGQKLSADDVKFTFDAYREPMPERAVWRAMWEDIESARVVDRLTIDFKMKGRHYLAFQSLMISMRILPKSYYAEGNEEKFRSQMVGTGPFRLSRFTPGIRLEFLPNKSWWNAQPPPFELVVKGVEDQKTALAMVQKGEVDFYSLSPMIDEVFLSEVQGSSALLEKTKVTMGEGLWLDLNLRRSLFQSRGVRQALLWLWDRSGLKQKLFGGRYQLALDTFSPVTDFYPKGQPESFSAQRAREALMQEGWSDSNRDGVLDKVIDGRRVDFSFQILVQSAAAERWVTLYQSDAAKVGVQVRVLRVEETAQYWQMLKNGRFDAVASGGGLSEVAHVSSWQTNAPYNFTGFSNSKVDQLLKKIDGEFDLKKRQSLEAQIISLIRAEHVQVPGLLSVEQSFLRSSRLQVDSTNPLQPWRWRLKR